MIRINLLPFKGKRKKKGPAFAFPGVLIALIVLGMIAGAIDIVVDYNLSSRITGLTETKAVKKKELDELKAKIKDVDEFYKKISQINQNKTVIVQLRQQQSVPVKVLDEIGRQLPENVWLVSLSVKDAAVNLNGATFTNDDVVKYVNNLKGSKIFQDVYLNVSQSSKIEGQDVFKFSITMQVRS
jgi:Tfp pilus assembly protein PilN